MKRYGPKVLVAGCGYLGLTTARSFHIGGFDVHGLTRSADPAERKGPLPFPMDVADITRRGDLEKFAGQFDSVVVCVSTRGGGAEDYRRLYIEGTRNVLEVIRPRNCVFTSSTSVYGDSDGAWVTEATPATPVTDTACVLREAEEMVLAAGGIVTRLGGIYGPGRAVHLRKFFEGTATIDGDGSRHINQVHRDDAAGALFLLLAWHATSGIYNVVDDTPVRQREMYSWLADVFGRPLPPSAPASEARKRGVANKRVSNAKLHAMGWRCRHQSFHAAVTLIAPTLLGSGDILPSAPLSAVA
jgi:nucleoside-diphosphate-sugar epimerase